MNYELIRTTKLITPTRDTHTNWSTNNPIIPEGILCFVKNRLYLGSLEYFIGDGNKSYLQLEKFGMYSEATTSAAGLMSTADKTKLDNIDIDVSIQTALSQPLNVVEKVQNLGNVGNDLTVTYSNGNIISLILTNSIKIIFPTDNIGGRTLTFIIEDGDQYSIDWGDNNIIWDNNTAPTLTGNDIISFITVNGSDWYGSVSLSV